MAWTVEETQSGERRKRPKKGMVSMGRNEKAGRLVDRRGESTRALGRTEESARVVDCT